MRAILSVLALLLTATFGAGMYLRQQKETSLEENIRTTATAVRAMQQELRVRAALAQTEVNGRGWPRTIDPSWFGENLPRNALVDCDRPWVELARTDEIKLANPIVRIAADRHTAAFWYNPATGIVRARAAVQMSDASTTSIYNRINSTALTSIFRQSDAFRRTLRNTPQMELAANKDDDYSADAMDPTQPREP